MFNNAAVAVVGELRDGNIQDFRRVVEVNLFGVVHGTMAAYRVMLNAMMVDGSGSIGLPIQLLEVGTSGARRVTDAEVQVVHDTLNALEEQECDLWVNPSTRLAQ